MESASACCEKDSTVPELAKRHGVHPNQIYTWKKQVLDNVAGLFARGVSASVDGEEEREREASKLYAKIGRLTFKLIGRGALNRRAAPAGPVLFTRVRDHPRRARNARWRRD